MSFDQLAEESFMYGIKRPYIKLFLLILSFLQNLFLCFSVLSAAENDLHMIFLIPVIAALSRQLLYDTYGYGISFCQYIIRLAAIGDIAHLGQVLNRNISHHGSAFQDRNQFSAQHRQEIDRGLRENEVKKRLTLAEEISCS